MALGKIIPLLVFQSAMLLAMYAMLGQRVVVFAASFSALWFVISFVLLTRPPALPEFIAQNPSQADMWGDEHTVVRRDVIPKVGLAERLRLSLTVACGSCMLIWLSLTLLGR